MSHRTNVSTCQRIYRRDTSPFLLIAVFILMLSYPFVPKEAALADSVPPDDNLAKVTGQWISPGGDALLEVTRGPVVGDDPQRPVLSIRLLRTLWPERDENNPDATLRSRWLSNIVLGEGFSPDGVRWTGGNLYDPGSGRTYKASLQLAGDHFLEVRGYVGIPALGKTQVWHRRDVYEQQFHQMLHGDTHHE